MRRVLAKASDDRPALDAVELPQLLQVNLFYYEHIQCVHTKKKGQCLRRFSKNNRSKLEYLKLNYQKVFQWVGKKCSKVNLENVWTILTVLLKTLKTINYGLLIP